jgi:mRNA-degrading endonuclease RelE of RelBE toxin-antitoxin system
MRLQPTRKFIRETKHLNKKFPSFRSDLAAKMAEVLENPHEGESIGQSCYKVRMAITSKGKGKSGGSRIITCVKIERDTIYLLTIYDKSEREDISDDELKQLLKQIDD